SSVRLGLCNPTDWVEITEKSSSYAIFQLTNRWEVARIFRKYLLLKDLRKCHCLPAFTVPGSMPGP
ncbi:hypothetical protein, partial [Desulfuromonas carbonis]